MRTLIAGFGNVLRGDDGFGVEVIRRLHEDGRLDADVELLDVGTGGIRLAQQLLGVYDRLIVVDAMIRGRPPGTLYALAVEGIEMAVDIDMHVAVPARALAVAKALGALPSEVWMVGCEPAVVDDLTIGLSPAVQGAVDAALAQVRQLLSGRTLAAASASGGPT